MAKRKSPKGNESADNSKRRIVVVAAITAAVAAAVVVTMRANRADRSKARQQQPVASVPASTPAPAEQSTPSSELVTMDVAKSVMVTVELDFGKKIPTIAEALTQVERRYQPDDGQGRTFAVLDAYGEATPDGKLHMSMHLSSEKPGGGQLIFMKTGEVLWRAKINSTSMPVQPKTLTMIVGSQTVDGSTNPSSIIEARVKPGDIPVRDAWPDGQERDMTFIYSACGCPVHVQTKRTGDRTVRVSDKPVIFPDDPDAVKLITRFMRW